MRLENVTRAYRRRDVEVRALDGVTLTLSSGMATAVTGPSGSGKSTLLSLAGGLERASAGKVTVLGTDLGTLPEEALAELRRDRLGFVFQNYHLIPTLTVCENVMLPLVPRFGLTLSARVRALHSIEKVGLENRIHHLPKELSGGEQQRAALARALVMRPALILADEPTGNLDPANAAVVLDLLLGLVRADGITVLLSTHSPEVAARCARQVRLEQGRVVEATG
ncbi:MAG: hypothetical protein A3K19_03895 [Lentisphaerae bacterium RIFOXYB12_FULL_65_16]|nr:MAG: hypothetical protein A3K18_02970 [Lentisphaerae bacterium RIFOXYA12_64_32]OGV89299.1 MAG: hypothetical protein A3K19_03895 [Lentisphaerae bacterium RIFOXYB12_FULL_65_16]